MRGVTRDGRLNAADGRYETGDGRRELRMVNGKQKMEDWRLKHRVLGGRRDFGGLCLEASEVVCPRAWVCSHSS